MRFGRHAQIYPLKLCSAVTEIQPQLLPATLFVRISMQELQDLLSPAQEVRRERLVSQDCPMYFIASSIFPSKENMDRSRRYIQATPQDLEWVTDPETKRRCQRHSSRSWTRREAYARLFPFKSQIHFPTAPLLRLDPNEMSNPAILQLDMPGAMSPLTLELTTNLVSNGTSSPESTST